MSINVAVLASCCPRRCHPPLFTCRVDRRPLHAAAACLLVRTLLARSPTLGKLYASPGNVNRISSPLCSRPTPHRLVSASLFRRACGLRVQISYGVMDAAWLWAHITPPLPASVLDHTRSAVFPRRIATNLKAQ